VAFYALQGHEGQISSGLPLADHIQKYQGFLAVVLEGMGVCARRARSSGHILQNNIFAKYLAQT
jgi:hypothetical protein